MGNGVFIINLALWLGELITSLAGGLAPLNHALQRSNGMGTRVHTQGISRLTFRRIFRQNNFPSAEL